LIHLRTPVWLQALWVYAWLERNMQDPIVGVTFSHKQAAARTPAKNKPTCHRVNDK